MQNSSHRRFQQPYSIKGYERLDQARLQVAAILPAQERSRLLACEHPLTGGGKHYCHSSACPVCSQLKRASQQHCLIHRLHTVQANHPDSQLYAATFTIEDTPLEGLRPEAQFVSESWTRLTKRPQVKAAVIGYHRTIEFDLKPAHSNIHVHSLMAMRPGYGGRHHISQARWGENWSAATKGRLRDVDIRRADDIEAWARYITKASPDEVADEWFTDLKDPQALLQRLEDMKGFRLYTSGGLLKLQHENIEEFVASGEFESTEQARRAGHRYCRLSAQKKAKAEAQGVTRPNQTPPPLGTSAANWSE